MNLRTVVSSDANNFCSEHFYYIYLKHSSIFFYLHTVILFGETFAKSSGKTFANDEKFLHSRKFILNKFINFFIRQSFSD